MMLRPNHWRDRRKPPQRLINPSCRPRNAAIDGRLGCSAGIQINHGVYWSRTLQAAPRTASKKQLATPPHAGATPTRSPATTETPVAHPPPPTSHTARDCRPSAGTSRRALASGLLFSVIASALIRCRWTHQFFRGVENLSTLATAAPIPGIRPGRSSWRWR